MVGGAHGLAGHLVLQHVVIVRRPDNVSVTTLFPQGVEVIVLVTVASNKAVIQKIVPVR